MFTAWVCDLASCLLGVKVNVQSNLKLGCLIQVSLPLFVLGV